MVIPISTAAGKAGNPIKVGDGADAIDGGQIAITPDGKTAYVPTNGTGTVIPISTATNRAGQPINLGHSRGSGPTSSRSPRTGRPPTSPAWPLTRSPRSARPPIPPASRSTSVRPGLDRDHPGREDGLRRQQSQPGTVTPIDTATNTAGQPIHVSHDPFDIAITPDGRTAYVLSRSSSKHTRAMVTPINTATNTPGQPIYLPGLGGYGFIAITPDGKTAYVTTGYPRAVIPISTATNRAGKPIQIDRDNASSSQIAITPDGKTAYVVSGPPRSSRSARPPTPRASRSSWDPAAAPAARQPSSVSRSPRTGRPPTSPARARSSRSARHQHSRSADPPPPRVPHGDRDHRAVTCTAARSRPGETPDRALTPRKWPANPVR